MIDKECRVIGLIDKEGNLKIFNQEKLNIFSRKHKNHKVVIEVKVIGNEPSQAIKGYFRNWVLPEFQKALMENGEYLTLQGTEEFITTLSPMLQEQIWDEKTESYICAPKKFEDLDIYEAVHCLTDLKQIASMEYNFNIEDEGYLK